LGGAFGPHSSSAGSRLREKAWKFSTLFYHPEIPNALQGRGKGRKPGKIDILDSQSFRYTTLPVQVISDRFMIISSRGWRLRRHGVSLVFINLMKVPDTGCKISGPKLG
jgi:hypothetical protein